MRTAAFIATESCCCYRGPRRTIRSAPWLDGCATPPLSAPAMLLTVHLIERIRLRDGMPIELGATPKG